ncbi:hypothetical protein O0L34_g3013 [Tuta absoluta]|nr:hypothetical protein O0L34_g3013 [Tuta absoluta]
MLSADSRTRSITSDPSEALGYKNSIIRHACGYYYETDSMECGSTRVCGLIKSENRIAKFANECIYKGYICLSNSEMDQVDMKECEKNVTYYDHNFYTLFPVPDGEELPLHYNQNNKQYSYLSEFTNFLSGLTYTFSKLGKVFML